MSVIETPIVRPSKSSDLVLKKVRIQNFKSIKDAVIEIDKLNILVGKNASGKTNLLEFFKFVKKIFNFKNFPYRPLVDWWSYSNVVYNQDERKDIIGTFYFKYYFEKKKINIQYKFRFGFFEGRYQIHYEQLKFLDIKVVRDGNIVTTFSETVNKMSEKEIKNLEKTIINYEPLRFSRQWQLTLEDVIEGKISRKKQLSYKINFLGKVRKTIFNKTNFWSILNTPLNKLITVSEEHEDSLMELRLIPFLSYENRTHIIYFVNSDLIEDDNKHAVINLFVLRKFYPNRYRLPEIDEYEFTSHLILNFFKNIIFLRHPNFYEIRRPKMIQGDLELSETSDNLQRILLNLFLKKGNLPKSILYALEHLFNGVSIGFKTTEDGRSFIIQRENNGEYKPPQLSDGLFKILSLLIGLEYSKSLLLIDEIENSLYYEALQFIIDEFRNKKGVQFLISTHSPIVVDLIDLGEIIMVEKDVESSTKFIKVKEPSQLKEFLAKEGISHSEAWRTEILKEK